MFGCGIGVNAVERWTVALKMLAQWPQPARLETRTFGIDSHICFVNSGRHNDRPGPMPRRPRPIVSRPYNQARRYSTEMTAGDSLTDWSLRLRLTVTSTSWVSFDNLKTGEQLVGKE